jgi:hypothetical protein
MAKKKQTVSAPALFEVEAVVKQVYNEGSTKKNVRNNQDYSQVCRTVDLESFEDYIKNGRNNSISWKPKLKL